MEGMDQKSRKFRCRISIRLYKRISSDQEEEVSQVFNSVGEDLFPAVVKKPKLATTSSIDSSVLPFSFSINNCTNVKIEVQKRFSVIQCALFILFTNH